MIRFSCRCGYVFEAPEDAAGIGLQCPECHLLNDVPYLGDASSIAGDGTYIVDDKPRQMPPDVLETMARYHGNTTLNEPGESLDLRNSAQELEEIGDVELSSDAARRNRPRYDPETGELVRPIPLSQERDESPKIDPSTIPFAVPTVNYAVNDTLRPKAASGVLLDLAQPINLVVMGFVLGIHLLIVLLTFAIAMRFLLVAPIALGLIVALLAHYGNVVDEIGPGERDELPRVMRDAQLSEDFLHPLMSMFFTTLICYGPSILTAIYSSLDLLPTLAISLVLAMAGTVFMPAVLLTLQTSGSAANLRPDRIVGVIRASGLRYFGSIIAFLVAFVPYAWAIVGFTIEAYRTWGAMPMQIPKWATMWPVSLPLMCFGIFAMHFFFWELGILYRYRAPAFPWIDQFHVRAPRPPVPRRKPKYITPPADDQGDSTV